MGDFFSKRCMALVGDDGKRLQGDALQAAENALTLARSLNNKVWANSRGIFFAKNGLFAMAKVVVDSNGNPVRICGRPVPNGAKFCSKCGTSAPGSWWRCSGCGKYIGIESATCPHCGKDQSPVQRQDFSDGRWRKGEEIFAERFEVNDLSPLMRNGLEIQANQCAIWVSGGEVVRVLAPGFYPASEFFVDPAIKVPNRTLIMLDDSDFALPIGVSAIRTKEDIESDLHLMMVLRFDHGNPQEFMRNLMGNNLYLSKDSISASVAYDEVAHCILQAVDSVVREFCAGATVEELYRSADLRMKLEDVIAGYLKDNLHSIGMSFVRLKECEFESAAFEHLRKMSGDIEVKRREIEFIRRADELANDATRRKAMSEAEMEDFMVQLAQEKNIKAELRMQEITRLKNAWIFEQQKTFISQKHDLADMESDHTREQEKLNARHTEDIRNIHADEDRSRLIKDQKTTLESVSIEKDIQKIQDDIARAHNAVVAEQLLAEQQLHERKKAFKQQQKLEWLNAIAGKDISVLLAVEDDREKRDSLLKLHEQQTMSRMTPELLLAAAAARGNSAAAEALSKLNKDQIAVIEQAKNENKEIYDEMLKMSERMFNQAAVSMAKGNAMPSTTTTQVIK